MPNYHFSLMDEDGRVIDAVDRACPDDGAAMHHARMLLSRCHAVEFLRGARVIGQVVRCVDEASPLPKDGAKPGDRRWWFQASPPPVWLQHKPPQSPRN